MSPEQAISKFIYNRAEPVALAQKLNARESAVWEYRQQGFTMEKISFILGCSAGSVWNHIEQIRKKGWRC